MTIKERKNLYAKLNAKGKIPKTKYIAVNENEKRKFNSRKELAGFFGYSEDYLTKTVKANKEIFGWKVIRYKWWEDSEVIGEV